MKTVAILGLILSYLSSGGLLTGGAIACLTHGPLGPSRPALPSCSSLWETARAVAPEAHGPGFESQLPPLTGCVTLDKSCYLPSLSFLMFKIELNTTYLPERRGFSLYQHMPVPFTGPGV